MHLKYTKNIRNQQIMVLLLCSVFLAALSIEAAPQKDQISNLPGLDEKPSFLQYSGYLNVPGGKYFHYWFVEAQQDPSSSPVVLWLNGGPGCSSLVGFLTGHGPFLVQEDGHTLKNNPHSWNKIANMLYLESPAGVGFSYSDNKSYEISDTQTARDNHMALKEFFHLFPEFKANDFYIAGESYGGFYVPCLAVEVSKDDSINLKGIAIGNGMTSFKIDHNSFMFFAYYHGLIGTELWSELQSACCEEDKCHFMNHKNLMCLQKVRIAYNRIDFSKLNVYNLYKPCESGLPGQVRDLGEHIVAYHPGVYNTEVHSRFREKLKKLSQLKKPIRLGMPCLDYTDINTYLNTPEVQKALHVQHPQPDWKVCSDKVFSLFIIEYEDVRDQYLEILKKGFRIFVYSGDVDMACNFLGVSWFINSLQLQDTAESSLIVPQVFLPSTKPLISEDPTVPFNECREKDFTVQVPYSVWYTKEDPPQIAGYVKQYVNLTLLTVKGAGHVVPTDKPEAAYIIFHHFINNEPF